MTMLSCCWPFQLWLSLANVQTGYVLHYKCSPWICVLHTSSPVAGTILWGCGTFTKCQKWVTRCRSYQSLTELFLCTLLDVIDWDPLKPWMEINFPNLCQVCWSQRLKKGLNMDAICCYFFSWFHFINMWSGVFQNHTMYDIALALWAVLCILFKKLIKILTGGWGDGSSWKSVCWA